MLIHAVEISQLHSFLHMRKFLCPGNGDPGGTWKAEAHTYVEAKSQYVFMHDAEISQLYAYLEAKAEASSLGAEKVSEQNLATSAASFKEDRGA